MAHHSEFNSEILQRFLEAAQNMKPGPTGQFPEGKLVPEDEGEIKVAITGVDGKVVINFGKLVAWIGFTPDQAEQIADSLREHAMEQRGEGHWSIDTEPRPGYPVDTRPRPNYPVDTE